MVNILLTPGTGTIQVSVAEASHAEDRVDVKQISNFAWQHLKAASTFRDRAIQIEIEAQQTGFEMHFVDIRSFVSATINSSVASLEALINELYLAHPPSGKLRPLINDFEKSFWVGLDKKDRGIQNCQILERYTHALSLLQTSPMDTDAAYFVNAKNLISLRNELTHYKPNWDKDRARKLNLSDDLKGCYEISPFSVETSDFITMKSMSSGCAIWAIETVLAFLREFDNRSKLDPDKLNQFWNLGESLPLE